jgi:hypothetical protein
MRARTTAASLYEQKLRAESFYDKTSSKYKVGYVLAARARVARCCVIS